jgi:hypothetical protein
MTSYLAFDSLRPGTSKFQAARIISSSRLNQRQSAFRVRAVCESMQTEANTVEWLFPQEKATLHIAKKFTQFRKLL